MYDLESILKHTMKSALEKALKQISLYDVLFPSSSVDESFEYSYSAQKADEDSKKPKNQKSRKGKKINYPKCAYPGCKKNRFARGKGFCGEHYRMYLAGEAKSAEEYADGAE